MPVTHAAMQANSTMSLRRKGIATCLPSTPLCSASLTMQEFPFVDVRLNRNHFPACYVLVPDSRWSARQRHVQHPFRHSFPHSLPWAALITHGWLGRSIAGFPKNNIPLKKAPPKGSPWAGLARRQIGRVSVGAVPSTSKADPATSRIAVGSFRDFGTQNVYSAGQPTVQ
jgi:hypothetical protein